ncbi:LuxR C-terminal-related transcriptional regulator [Nocardioides renjunii]|uniref:LuxR C-terminal-related transcriptional regulator n=1 Tax=Nocardioides renjunii TaxID=3095075 RepID=UPI002AFFE7A9|nr:LuxR C-terminal-related transcriptional regulator [Nocardioides sp. S-34]WQQ20351.1 LuxR C-terminal-related transcriptional regulator [Nocardioides sp. S-34]
MVEILRDGSTGPWMILTASDDDGTGPAAPPALAATTLPPSRVDPVLEVHLGRVQASQGHHREAVRSWTKALRAATTGSLRHRCLAQLALVDAYMGRLARSAEHDRRAERIMPGVGGDTLQLARAVRHLAQGDLPEARRRLELVVSTADVQDEPWEGTLRLLLGAELLIATGRPDAASRLLAEALAVDGTPTPGWSSGVLLARRADALAAEGELHRALALVTPLPAQAAAEAGVVAADMRAAIGDMRGAQAVLTAVVDELDLAPALVQVRAWVLEARLEQHRGNTVRSRVLVDRALQAAAGEDMPTPLRRDWQWLRATLDRDLPLRHAHREILAGLDRLVRDSDVRPRLVDVSRAPQPEVLGGALTERESQVLELLAEMYSTEEIAAALFVSGNTVKTHLKGIFAKLCVNRRVDAVRRGRQLGLC